MEAQWLHGRGVMTPDGRVLEESFELLVPSEIPKGSHPIALGAVDLRRQRISVEWRPVGEVVIE